MAGKRSSRIGRDQKGNAALIFALSGVAMVGAVGGGVEITRVVDRKSTRLNSSHVSQSRMPSSA